MNDSILEKKLEKIKGKTIAIVYIFEGDDNSGFEHFYIWKSNIISKWMTAVQELSCMPLIIDVRTFIDKAINHTLPHIDFVINMNSGTYQLSTMALVPAMCSAINVPCIPCDAVTTVTGENKLLSNLIASSLGLKVPNTLCKEDDNGIFRPTSLGNSLGVKKGKVPRYEDGIYQEFITGVEITTPMVYCTETDTMETLPTVAFVPPNYDPNWFYGEQDKKKQQGYKFKIIPLENALKKKYIELTKTLSLRTYCRIDARINCRTSEEMYTILDYGAFLQNTYFIEINVMPTIRDKNSFCFSFESVDKDCLLWNNIELQKEKVGSIDVNSFLLANSMMAFISIK